MADLIAIEPALFNPNEAWFIFSDGRKCLRKTERAVNTSRSDFPTPTIRKDSIDPQWGADGKMYDSLSALRKTYLPENNPKGERFHEIGNEEMPTVTYDFDKKQRREDIKAAIEDVKNGRVPPVTVLED